jgi:hypothetical protein
VQIGHFSFSRRRAALNKVRDQVGVIQADVAIKLRHDDKCFGIVRQVEKGELRTV